MSNLVSFLLDEKRYPIYFVFDCLVTCFAVSAFFKFPNLVGSLAMGIILPTYVDNFVSLLQNKELAVIKNPYLLLISTLIQVSVTFVPYALIVLLKLTPLIAVFAGLNLGRDVITGVKIGETKSWKEKSFVKFIVAVLFGVLCGCGKYIVIGVISIVTGNSFRSLDTIVGITAVVSILEAARGNVCKSLNIKVKNYEVFILLVALALNMTRTYLPDNLVSYYFAKFF